MELTLDPGKSNYLIRSYAVGKIIINDQTYTHSLIISPTEVIPWAPQSLAEITSSDFKVIAEKNPEVFLLGTGETQLFPHPAILAPLINLQIGTEVMNTGAACRTFNVLAQEGRNVIAALLI